MTHGTPFGKASRVAILRDHLTESQPISAKTAWMFIYRELLWIDTSTGLAHLYESDKAQPGRPWYDRSVIFTDLLCDQFGGISREELNQQIDRLFRACLVKLIDSDDTTVDDDVLAELAAAGMTNLVSLESRPSPAVEEDEHKPAMYVPDTSLVIEYAALLERRAGMTRRDAESLARELVAKARFYFTVERKRQNVLGEGFEDLLQLLIVEVSRVSEDLIRVRQRANKLPGFQRLRSTRTNRSA